MDGMTQGPYRRNMSHRLSLTLATLVVAGCEGPYPLPTTSPVDAREAALPPAYLGTERCEGGSDFDFEVRASGLWAWEGRRVVASAVARDKNDENSDPVHRRAVISGVIQDGSFRLSCARSLPNHPPYPSWAVFVDLDGDGRCSPGDAGHSTLLYTWLFDVNEEVPAAGWSTVGTEPSTLYGPVSWRVAPGFCGGFFD